jgi:hypothetical protein
MRGLASIARRPTLAAAALLAATGAALWPTPAVPLAATDAAVPYGPDAGAGAAEGLAVQAVLRVTGAEEAASLPRLVTT